MAELERNAKKVEILDASEFDRIARQLEEEQKQSKMGLREMLGAEATEEEDIEKENAKEANNRISDSENEREEGARFTKSNVEHRYDDSSESETGARPGGDEDSEIDVATGPMVEFDDTNPDCEAVNDMTPDLLPSGVNGQQPPRDASGETGPKSHIEERTQDASQPKLRDVALILEEDSQFVHPPQSEDVEPSSVQNDEIPSFEQLRKRAIFVPQMITVEAPAPKEDDEPQALASSISPVQETETISENKEAKSSTTELPHSVNLDSEVALTPAQPSHLSNGNDLQSPVPLGVQTYQEQSSQSRPLDQQTPPPLSPTRSNPPRFAGVVIKIPTNKESSHSPKRQSSETSCRAEQNSGQQTKLDPTSSQSQESGADSSLLEGSFGFSRSLHNPQEQGTPTLKTLETNGLGTETTPVVTEQSLFFPQTQLDTIRQESPSEPDSTPVQHSPILFSQVEAQSTLLFLNLSPYLYLVNHRRTQRLLLLLLQSGRHDNLHSKNSRTHEQQRVPQDSLHGYNYKIHLKSPRNLCAFRSGSLSDRDLH
ncbi:hypothetical protein BT69DRAFT_617777 [Atractiella rhizophila]|nr:hypothetical protein BT69DRAFT_617777 [Atractiella rhizophila]